MARDARPMPLPPALRFPRFRRLSLSTLLGSVSLMGEQVVLGWLALEASGSPLFVGIVLGLRMLPLFVLGIPAGAMADRHDPAALMRWAACGLAAQVAVLGILVQVGLVAAWHLPLFALATGSGNAVYQAARQGAAHGMVGDAGLVGGLALIGLATRLGGLPGSLLAGVLLARSATAACALLAASYAAAALAAPGGRLATRPAPPRAAEPFRPGLLDAVRSARDDRRFAWILTLTVAVEVFGFSHQALLPSLARDVLRIGPGGLGVLTAARSAGGLVATSLVALRPHAVGSRGQFLAATAAFGGALLALAAAPGYATVVAAVLLVNAVAALSDVLTQALVQLALPGRRGRAGGAWVAAVGTAPVGQLQIGALASVLGVPLALALNGLALLLAAAAGTWLRPRGMDRQGAGPSAGRA